MYWTDCKYNNIGTEAKQEARNEKVKSRFVHTILKPKSHLNSTKYVLNIKNMYLILFIDYLLQ